MPETITLEKLKGLIDERLKDTMGMQPAEWKEHLSFLKRVQEEAKESRRQYAQELAATNIPKSYALKAKRFIDADREKGAGLMAARLLRCIALSKVAQTDPLVIAKQWGDEWLAEAITEGKAKALNTADADQGGVLVTEQISSDFIELLRAKSIFRNMGARQITMDSKVLTFHRQTGTSTAEWLGELQEQNESQPTVDMIKLILKRLQVIVAMSNQFLRYSSPQADVWVRDDMLQAMTLKEDIAFLRGTGTEHSPKGVRYQALAGNVSARTQASGTGSTLVEMTDDLFAMIENVEGANVPLQRPGWVTTSRERSGLMRWRDGNGNLVFLPELQAGTLLGYPVAVTNQIPKNLGGGDESEIYFIDFNQVVIGDGKDMEFKSWDGGAYRNSAGQIVSGIAADATVMRMASEVDFAMLHPEAAAIRTAVDWYDHP